MSLATVIASVEATIKADLAAVENGLEKVAETVAPVVVDAAEAFLREIFTIAAQAVLAEAPKVISGTEKFGNAVTNVIQTVEAQGKTILLQDAQMAVQGGYHIVQLQLPTN